MSLQKEGEEPEYDKMVDDKKPEVGKVYLCRLQHWHSKNSYPAILKSVDENDCDWRPYQIGGENLCELSHDYTVIEWQEIKWKENP